MIADAEANATAEDFAGRFLAGLVGLAAIWAPDGLAGLLDQALELAALEGREAVFTETDDADAFAEPDFTRSEFREQIAFLTQKRPTPSRVWTDFMQGQHDRALVVAGVTDQAMIDEFATAIVENARSIDIRGFTAAFDRIVETYGWSYNGGREWRIRTIFETNIRTSYMAGRLKQMRDPDVVRLRPYWQYIHAATRVPLTPREQHVAWDQLVLDWDDPWWNTYFPPNDWRCSCGVSTLSRRDLARLGKAGPDQAPPIVTRPFVHRASGQTVMLPDGTGFGWNYMPGDLWERGLVPSVLIDEAGGVSAGRHLAQIDEPGPVEDLMAAARPFVAQPLPEGLPTEDYVNAFLRPFGAEIGQAVLWTDRAGMRIPVSAEFFRDRAGLWKVDKRGRAVLTPLMAEALMDPDEIWIGVVEKAGEWLVDRRYIRVDPDSGLILVLEMGRLWWEPVTIYRPTDKKGAPDLRLLGLRRGGKLVWRR